MDKLTGYDIDALTTLFFTAYAEPFAEKEETDSAFILAMRNIESNWRVLGFPTLHDAAQAISTNFF